MAESIEASLKERALAGRRWLFEAALPLWWRNGYDQTTRCFYESLDQSGAPASAPRRIRSQARQTFAFARAGVMGWEGPWRDACEAGVAVLLERGIRADGGTRHALGADGERADDRRDLYDLSCVLLALAEAARAGAQTAHLSGGSSDRLGGHALDASLRRLSRARDRNRPAAEPAHAAEGEALAL